MLKPAKYFKWQLQHKETGIYHCDKAETQDREPEMKGLLRRGIEALLQVGYWGAILMEILKKEDKTRVLSEPAGQGLHPSHPAQEKRHSINICENDFVKQINNMAACSQAAMNLLMLMNWLFWFVCFATSLCWGFMELCH